MGVLVLNWLKRKILRAAVGKNKLYQLKCLCSSQDMIDAAIQYCYYSHWTIDDMIDYITITGKLPQKGLEQLPMVAIIEARNAQNEIGCLP